jgi:hypothetical protein
MPAVKSPRVTRQGKPWKEAELAARYPALVARFADGDRVA